MNYHNNEDAGDCAMMNAADASEYFSSNEGEEMVCEDCGNYASKCDCFEENDDYDMSEDY